MQNWPDATIFFANLDWLVASILVTSPPNRRVMPNGLEVSRPATGHFPLRVSTPPTFYPPTSARASAAKGVLK